MGNSFSGNTATNTAISNFIIPDGCTVEDLIILQNDYKLSDNNNTKKSSEVPDTTELPNISEVPIIPIVPKIKVKFFARVNNRDEHRTELDKILIWATSDTKVLKQNTNRYKMQSTITKNKNRCFNKYLISVERQSSANVDRHFNFYSGTKIIENL